MLTNLHRLSSEAMIGHSFDFLHRPDTRTILESDPLGVGVLDRVSHGHERLTAVLSRRQALDARAAELTTIIIVVESTHDDSVRSLYGFCTAFIDGLDDPALVAEFIAARSHLFPNDLAVIKRSYTDKHGAAVQTEEHMTPEVRALLARTEVGDTTLLAIYDRWIAAGMRLGELVRERTRIEDLRRPRAEGEAATALKEARKVWLAAMRMALTALDHLPLSYEQKREILAPIERDILASTRTAEAETETEDEVPADGEAPIDGDGEEPATESAIEPAQ